MKGGQNKNGSVEPSPMRLVPRLSCGGDILLSDYALLSLLR